MTNPLMVLALSKRIPDQSPALWFSSFLWLELSFWRNVNFTFCNRKHILQNNKTNTRNPKPIIQNQESKTRYPKPGIQNKEPQTMHPKPGIKKARNPKPGIQDKKSKTRNPQPGIPNQESKPNNIKSKFLNQNKTLPS